MKYHLHATLGIPTAPPILTMYGGLCVLIKQQKHYLYLMEQKKTYNINYNWYTVTFTLVLKINLCLLFSVLLKSIYVYYSVYS